MKLSEIHLILAEQRKNQNLSQKDIAEILNVEQATVSLYENGKRGIPLGLLDDWLELLQIEVKTIPKGFEPTKSEKDIENDLQNFNELKKKRNYLIAEMRAMMAEKLLQVPEFQKIDEESGEGAFWPYSFHTNESVGLVETRYDHPQQKFLAVEYTKDEVNVYKHFPARDIDNCGEEMNTSNICRIYFSEDDFLTFGSLWDHNEMELRKVTILRKSSVHPDGVEIVDPESFSIRTLAEMMENHNRFTAAVEELELDWKYVSTKRELESVGKKIHDISLNNQLVNGTPNPDFVIWNETDIEAISVPLWGEERCWLWIEEGVLWTEAQQEIEQ